MKREFALFLTIVLLGTAVFAAKKSGGAKGSSRTPNWLTNLESVYPESRYLARVGHGMTEDAARAKALADIAGYFKTQVQSTTKGTSKMYENNGEVSKQRAIEQETVVQTEMDLIGVEYTEAYYDKKKDEYHACAYIDREVAWSIIEPEINKYRNKYESLYERALREKELVLRYKYLYKSRAAGEELVNRLSFGFLLYPAKREEFQEKINEISNDAVFGVLEEQSIPLYLDIKGDQDGRLAGAMTKVFSSFGFTVSQQKSASQKYVLHAIAHPNEQVDPDLEIVAVRPNIEIKLANISTGEELYTWLKSYGKTSNFSLAAAMRQSYSNVIIKDIENTVPGDYRAKLMAD